MAIAALSDTNLLNQRIRELVLLQRDRVDRLSRGN